MRRVVVGALALPLLACGGSPAGSLGGASGDSGASGATGAAGSGGSSGAAGVGDQASCAGPAKGTWIAMSTMGAPQDSVASQLFWTGTAVYDYSRVSAGLYQLCTDTWSASPTPTMRMAYAAPVPAADLFTFFEPAWSPPSFVGFDYRKNQQRDLSVAGTIPAANAAFVTTGTKLVEWGGGISRGTNAGFDGTQRGAIYDPARDAWTPMTTTGAPSARVAPAAWTGSSLVVWGGHSADTHMVGQYQYDCVYHYEDLASTCAQYRDGAIYDPARDAWTPMAAEGAPKARFDHLLEWTGDRVLVWGGGEQGSMDPVLFTGPKQWLADGGLYDPVAKTWTAIPAVPVANATFMLDAYAELWTGDRLAVVENGAARGWLYDPRAGAWTSLAQPPDTGYCEDYPAAQAGALVMICEIGAARSALLLLSGETTWRTFPLPMDVAKGPARLWTGKRLFVWGGTIPPTVTCSGAQVGCDPPPPTYSDAGWMLEP